jgi:hypothetical protein
MAVFRDIVVHITASASMLLVLLTFAEFHHVYSPGETLPTE